MYISTDWIKSNGENAARPTVYVLVSCIHFTWFIFRVVTPEQPNKAVLSPIIVPSVLDQPILYSVLLSVPN
jgi:hypothetical protein